MERAQYALLAVALAVPAVAWRLPGPWFWVAMALGFGAAAALAAWALQDEGQLRAAFTYQAGDPTLAFVVAVGLYLPLWLVVTRWVAPNNLLQLCAADGVFIPRPDEVGFGRFLELVRVQSCEAYGRTAYLKGLKLGLGAALVAALEELAWRGGVQQALSQRLGSTRGWLAASGLYALSLLATGNLVVAALALLGGLAWGALYRFRGGLLSCVLAHALFVWILLFVRPVLALR
ncbi:MAG: CPBP family intramembrane metalloprotease [Deltaproteobacteria bacterium]|nr:CPBP family intramembrane metalloprotease [Deltaproteobacteria bacterium]